MANKKVAKQSFVRRAVNFVHGVVSVTLAVIAYLLIAAFAVDLVAIPGETFIAGIGAVSVVLMLIFAAGEVFEAARSVEKTKQDAWREIRSMVLVVVALGAASCLPWGVAVVTSTNNLLISAIVLVWAEGLVNWISVYRLFKHVPAPSGVVYGAVMLLVRGVKFVLGKLRKPEPPVSGTVPLRTAGQGKTEDRPTSSGFTSRPVGPNVPPTGPSRPLGMAPVSTLLPKPVVPAASNGQLSNGATPVAAKPAVARVPTAQAPATPVAEKPTAAVPANPVTVKPADRLAEPPKVPVTAPAPAPEPPDGQLEPPPAQKPSLREMVKYVENDSAFDLLVGVMQHKPEDIAVLDGILRGRDRLAGKLGALDLAVGPDQMYSVLHTWDVQDNTAALKLLKEAIMGLARNAQEKLESTGK